VVERSDGLIELRADLGAKQAPRRRADDELGQAREEVKLALVAEAPAWGEKYGIRLVPRKKKNHDA
jgi:hypothetical protein